MKKSSNPCLCVAAVLAKSIVFLRERNYLLTFANVHERCTYVVSIVQWIEQQFPKLLIRVRFPVEILFVLQATCPFSKKHVGHEKNYVLYSFSYIGHRKFYIRHIFSLFIFPVYSVLQSRRKLCVNSDKQLQEFATAAFPRDGGRACLPQGSICLLL